MIASSLRVYVMAVYTRELTVPVAWVDNGAFPGPSDPGWIYIDRTLQPGGQIFGTDVLVATIDPLQQFLPGITDPPYGRFRASSFPTIAVDRSNGPFRGAIYIAWADETGVNASGPDILFSRSTDGGQTWCSPPIRVSDDTAGPYPTGQYQWFPWMTVNSQGVIDIVFYDFYDRRNATQPDQFQVYRARSQDGGLTFSANVPVTDTMSDLSNDVHNMRGFIGDYIGLGAPNDQVYAAWTDLRGPNMEAFFAAATPASAPCPGPISVVTSSMYGFNDSGPSADLMTVHFGFSTTAMADEFKIRYKRTFLSPPGTPDADWIYPSACSHVSATCARGCGTAVEFRVVEECRKIRFEWQAQASNCQGWTPGWTVTKTFTTPVCLEEP
jgi:hypothetical protein